MQRAPIDGIELEYERSGSGEPVVLMHAGVCADFFLPLSGQSALADRHTVLRYHRAGYAGSDRVPGALRFAQQAAHCHALMEHVGIERAHVVEPALERYRAGDMEGAVDVWMQGTCGAGYREPLERALPEAFGQAVADAGTFFGQELPAVQWSFGEEEAARIGQPALAVLGEHSAPVFPERRDLLLAWLPNVEPFELPGATHLLHVQEPRAMADALVAFFARHG